MSSTPVPPAVVKAIVFSSSVLPLPSLAVIVRLYDVPSSKPVTGNYESLLSRTAKTMQQVKAPA